MPHRRHLLVARLDSAGDVLLAGPAVRAAAATGHRVTMLVSRRGAAAAALLPGVDHVEVFDAPWVLADPDPVRLRPLARLVLRLRRAGVDEAVVLTSFHQSPLPLALLLRLAGVGRVVAESHDYPGSLLDERVALHDGLHEAQRAQRLAIAARWPDRGPWLAVHEDLPDVERLVGGAITGPATAEDSAARPPTSAMAPASAYVVVHPGADAPARQWPASRCGAAVEALVAAGYRVVVTGGPDERALTAQVAGRLGVDLGGRTDLAHLAAVLRGANAVVVGNTGPAHLAAAVGTPVVSLFAPVVSAHRWQPYGVPVELLGDQEAACAGSRWRVCQLPGHPCLTAVTPDDVVAAVQRLVARAGMTTPAHEVEA